MGGSCEKGQTENKQSQGVIKEYSSVTLLLLVDELNYGPHWYPCTTGAYLWSTVWPASGMHGCICLSENNRLVAKTSGAPVSLPRLSWCRDAGSWQGCWIAVLLGHTDGVSSLAPSGVRVFHSSPAASSLDYIGGPAILLGLISLATDDHTMYAAMKVLHSVLTSSAMCDYLMQHISGYQVIPTSRLTLQPPKELSPQDELLLPPVGHDFWKSVPASFASPMTLVTPNGDCL